MAKPIKETPILTGKDAYNFSRNNSEVAKVTSKELSNIKDNYMKLKTILA